MFLFHKLESILALAVGIFLFLASPAFAVADLNVKITDQGAPLAGTSVSLTFPDGTTETYEDDDGDGQFNIPVPYPGHYQITINTPGYDPQTVPVEPPEDGQVDIAYDPGLNTGVAVLIYSLNDVVSELAQPINVGPKEDVGTKSAGKKVASGIMKSVGGLFGGGSSSRNSSSQEPKTKRDPARKAEETVITDPVTGLSVEVRTRWVEDGLLISTNIDKHKDKGTFQYVFLADQYGNQLPPARYEVYKIWVKHTLTVSWTKSTYVDGGLVSQESGGWSESWIEDLGTFKRRVDFSGVAQLPPIWALMGYDRAHAGVRRLGTIFQMTPETLAQAGAVAVIIHITQPKMDPVMTTPFALRLSLDSEGNVLTSPMTTAQPVIPES